MNTAAILRGPALLQWRGFTCYHRDKLEIPVELATFDIEVEPFGVIESRGEQGKLPIHITPAGRVSEVENLVNRYAHARTGDLINVEEFPVAVNTGTNVLTCLENHLLADGDEVMVHALITMPAGLSKTTRYYARVTGNSATTVTLYDTEAHALDTAHTTGLVDITDAGSAVVLDVTRALTITTYSGLRIKYFNAALTKIPELEFSAVKPMLGGAEFSAFIRNGQDPDDATNRYYAISAATPTDTSFAPGDIKTQPPKLTWAFSAAWAALQTREGAKVTFDMKTEDLPSDAFGKDALGRIFSNLSLGVSAMPQGITEADAMAGLELQAKARGEKLAGGQLDLVTEFYTFTVADAILTKAPQTFSSKEQRSGAAEWKSQKKFTGGVQDPVYELTPNA